MVDRSVDTEADEEAIIGAYCDELAALGVEGYGRAACRRDYVLSKLILVYGHVAAEDLIDLGEERGARLFERMRERLFARIPPPPYDSLLDETQG